MISGIMIYKSPVLPGLPQGDLEVKVAASLQTCTIALFSSRRGFPLRTAKAGRGPLRLLWRRTILFLRYNSTLRKHCSHTFAKLPVPH